jgi:pre-mRNA-processing factor 40
MVAAPAFNTSEPEYGSIEEAEGAFMKMLKRHNVQPDWTWEQTMRTTIKDPQYRSLKDPRDRQAAFEKYAVEVRMQEKDRAKERFAKLRADFNTMLQRHPEIKHYSRWKTIRPIIEGETTFRATSDENERRQLFEEYVVELRKTHVEQEASKRKAAMDELVNILNGLDLEPYTRWSEAQAVIESNEKVQSDDKFKTLSKSDILTAFENHIKSLERTFNDARQQQKAIRARKERRGREQFIDLLKELRSQGKIKAGSKWMNICPLVQNDPRYQGMLGQSGSTPLDLFWDMVEEEERSLRGPRNDVLDVLDVSESRPKPFFFICAYKFFRTNATRLPPILLSKNSILLSSLIGVPPKSTRTFFSFSSSASRTKQSVVMRKRNMQPIATSAGPLMLCDPALSALSPQCVLQIHGIRCNPV